MLEWMLSDGLGRAERPTRIENYIDGNFTTKRKAGTSSSHRSKKAAGFMMTAHVMMI